MFSSTGSISFQYSMAFLVSFNIWSTPAPKTNHLPLFESPFQKQHVFEPPPPSLFPKSHSIVNLRIGTVSLCDHNALFFVVLCDILSVQIQFWLYLGFTQSDFSRYQLELLLLHPGGSWINEEIFTHAEGFTMCS